MTLRVEVFGRGHGRTSESELATLVSWEKELFAKDREVIDAVVWENKRGLGFNIQTYLDDQLVGFAHVFVRLAQRNEEPVLMGCLGGVMTAKEHQGAGIGHATMKKAGEVILRNLRADLGVLLCTPALVPFYARLGWRRFECPVMVEQPTGTISWTQEAMALLRDGDDAMPRAMNLCGLPF